MGLDTVEIVMRVEKTFNIQIPDQEAEKILTVGDLHQVVWQHLEGKHSVACKSQVLFYKLRQAVMDSFASSRQDFRPDAPMNDIFPLENRRQVYARFARDNNVQFPDLVLTKPWSDFLNYLAFITILGGLACSLLLIFLFDYSKWSLLIPAAGIALTWLTSEMLNPMRTVIQPISVRSFTQEVLVLNYATLAKENGTNRKEVETVINYIIEEIAGVEPHEIIPEAKFGDDLGVD